MFDVSLIDGDLQPLRNNKCVTTNRRESLLNGDGWTVTREKLKARGCVFVKKRAS
jgi:hypothetical protein